MWELFQRAAPFLVEALGVTVFLGVTSFAIGSSIGLSVALIRMSKLRVLKAGGAQVQVDDLILDPEQRFQRRSVDVPALGEGNVEQRTAGGERADDEAELREFREDLG